MITKGKKSAATLPLVRCAVYTRKSTEEGLEQEFNSLDAQRESAEAFIRSQTHEGWTCLPERYDDGGFTGGNMERPALQCLLTDIRAGTIDCVISYKVERLSRSLLDFAKMMEAFEQQGVSFVSVTQQFNTATSMGRLVLNVLLSFAQFEREIIAECTRDKMAATRRKGKWSGGTPVLGYDSEVRKLLTEVGSGASSGTAVTRLAELQGQLAQIEQRLARLRGQLEALQQERLDQAAATEALAGLVPARQAMTPDEQARVVRLLVSRVDYDGQQGKASITFQPLGLKTLAGEMLGRNQQERTA